MLNFQSGSLFGVVPEGVGVVFARFSGIALIGLGIACLPPKDLEPQQSAVRDLFVLNLGAAIFFAWIAIVTVFRGFILWPVVIVHALIATALVPQLLIKDSAVS